jgi:hypothetical protein
VWYVYTVQYCSSSSGFKVALVKYLEQGYLGCLGRL